MVHRIGRPHRQGRPAQRIATAIFATALTTTGCQGMTATHGSNTALLPDRPYNTIADWPLRFVRHNFGIATYAVQDCSVVYADRPHTSGPRPALEDVHPNSLNVKTANHLMIRNFPAPAIVRWTSQDGTPLEADIDIGEIFKDELILHETPREDISQNASVGNPDILMEVNDRTINVYMRVFISLKEPRIPGNPHSRFRDDLVLAWSNTY